MTEDENEIKNREEAQKNLFESVIELNHFLGKKIPHMKADENGVFREQKGKESLIDDLLSRN